MRTYVLLLTLITLSFSLLVGCQNTAEGLNQDIQHNTHAVRQSINEN